MSGNGWSLFRTKISLRIFLSMMILAALVPPIVILAIVIFRTSEIDRASANKGLIDSAGVIASMVHGSLLTNVEMLRNIGAHANEGDREEPNPSDLQVINRHFLGQAEIEETGQEPDFGEQSWSVSNLVDISPGEKANIVFSVPLETGTSSRLTVTADSTAISRNINFGDVTASGMLVAVVDGNGKIITRSVAAADNLGKPVPTWQALLDVGAPSGAFNAVAFDGTDISFGFSSIAGTPGWVVVVGQPKAVLDARWQTPLLAFGIGTLVTLGVALLLALLLAQRINHPIAVMVKRSQAIALDEADPLPVAPKSLVSEFDTLFNAQYRSQERLTERARELQLWGQRYRAIAKIGAMVSWRATRSGTLLEIEGWEDFTGQTQGEALGRGWAEMVEPDDLKTLFAKLEEANNTGADHVTVEVRVHTTSDTWTWVNVRGAVVYDGDGKPTEWIGTLENIDERKRLQLRISHMAYHDGLTGLPNRTLLAEHFSQLWADPSPLSGALLYVDLDKFKQANDTFGHAAGDALLRQVAGRLNQMLRGCDLAARLGGDEFAVVLSELENDDYSIMVASRIVKSLSQPFDIDGNTIEIGASVGIALFKAGVTSIERLQFEADSALYRAKTGGRNRWSFNTDADEGQPQRA